MMDPVVMEPTELLHDEEPTRRVDLNEEPRRLARALVADERDRRSRSFGIDDRIAHD